MNSDSGGSAATERSSTAGSHSSSPTTHLKSKTKTQITTHQRELDEVPTDEDTIMWYVHTQKPHPDRREELIACYHTMCIVNHTKKFFQKEIVTKTRSFKDHPNLHKFQVVISDI